MPKHRTHGEGDVEAWAGSKSQNTRYRARKLITLPNGTRKRVIAYGPDAKTAIRKREAKILQVLAENPDQDNLTIKQFAHQWLSHKKPTLAPSTIDDYAKTIRNHIIPTLGDKPMQHVTPLDLEHMQSSILRAGQKGQRKTKNLNAAEKARKRLKSMYKQALRWQLITNDPTLSTEPVQRHPPKRGIWSPSETQAFLEALRTGTGPHDPARDKKHYAPRMSWYYALFYAALTLGLRRGELVALKWSDIRTGALHVQRTYSQVGKDFQLGPPKTRESNRVLPLSDSLQRVLREHQERLAHHAERTTRDYTPNDWVFPSRNGTLLYPPNLRNRLHDYARKAGVPPIRIHDLRRVFSTNFIRAGGSPKHLQRWLGHATANVAMNIYADVVEADLTQSVVDLEQVFRSPINNPINNPMFNKDAQSDDAEALEEASKILAVEGEPED